MIPDEMKEWGLYRNGEPITMGGEIKFKDDEKGSRMTREEYEKCKPANDACIVEMLKSLAEHEAKFAHDRYGYYHSPHEGLAVIDEEVHEAQAEADIVQGNMNWLRRTVFSDFHGERQDATKRLYDAALHLAQEALHVAATALRFQQASEHGEGEWAPREEAK